MTHVARIVFADLDNNSSGTLDKSEIQQALEDVLDDSINTEEFERIFEKMDKDSDGSVSFDEFLTFLPRFESISPS